MEKVKVKLELECSECGERFVQEVEYYVGTTLTSDEYDEYCEECNRKASR